MKLLSICIPTYEMHGLGDIFLKHSFDILEKQTFKNFDVVISDHSKTDLVKNLCDEYKDKLNINYYKNTENVGNSSANINNAIKKATGKLIKILFQDDFLYSKDSLKNIVKNFNLEKDNWLITGCEHSKDGINFYRSFYPKYNHKIHLGNNTISSPSVLTIKNKCPLLFDEKLIWLMDCDYYKRCYQKYGKPKILNKINVVNRTGDYQVSNTIANKTLRKNELQYILKKYGKKIMTDKIKLDKVTLVAVSSIKIDETIKALEQSMNNINYYEVLLITHQKPHNLNENIKFKKCQPINSINDYSRFMIYDLTKYIDTEFALVVQYDGYIIRPHKWNDIFLNYDYIGAPWPPNIHFTKDNIAVRVGNGGFSLRSKKLLNAFNKLKLPFIDNKTGYFNEDGVICNYYRKELEEYGIKFAPVKIASMFSRELNCDDSHPEPFGFHKYKKLIPKLLLIKNFLEKIKEKVKKYSMDLIAKTKYSIKFILRKFKNLFFKNILNNNTIDKKEIKNLINRDNPIIFEIGCADGLDTLEFLKVFDMPGLKMYCFEPDPRNIKIFKERINDPRVQLFELAIGDIDGKMIFNQSSTIYSSSLKKPNLKNLNATWPEIKFENKFEVETISLDRFLLKHNIKMVDFVWADVQGAEDLMLNGAKNSLLSKIRYLYTEYSNIEYYENEPNLKDILNHLGNNWKLIRKYRSDVLLKNKNL